MGTPGDTGDSAFLHRAEKLELIEKVKGRSWRWGRRRRVRRRSRRTLGRQRRRGGLPRGSLPLHPPGRKMVQQVPVGASP